MEDKTISMQMPTSENIIIELVDPNNIIVGTMCEDEIPAGNILSAEDTPEIDEGLENEVTDKMNSVINVGDDIQVQDERLQEAELIINLQRGTQRMDTLAVVGETSQKNNDAKSAADTNTTVAANSDTSEVLTIERKQYHECYICKMRFKSITNLFKHRVAHNEKVQNTFNCDICNQVFTDPTQLEKHKYLHIEVRVLRCGICLETFYNAENYNYHVRVHDSEGPYVCNICSQVFNKKQQYLAHHYEHNPTGEPSARNILQCEVCNKIFPEAHKLKRHMMYHNGEKYHSCIVCQKRFVERSKLTRHMLTHSGKREFNCPVCNKSFTLKFNMQQHMNIHKGYRPHKCEKCGKAFTQRVVMQRHMKVHEEPIIQNY